MESCLLPLDFSILIIVITPPDKELLLSRKTESLHFSKMKHTVKGEVTPFPFQRGCTYDCMLCNLICTNLGFLLSTPVAFTDARFVSLLLIKSIIQ